MDTYGVPTSERAPSQIPDKSHRQPTSEAHHPNRVGAEIEAAILAHGLDHPSHGALRVSHELMLKGVQVSSSCVRGVWSRHDLLTKPQRLLRLEKSVAERRIELSEDQIRLLERFSPEFLEHHIETRTTGDLVAVDTFFVGHLKGIGKVYLQSVIDCHSRYAWGRLYTSQGLRISDLSEELEEEGVIPSGAHELSALGSL